MKTAKKSQPRGATRHVLFIHSAGTQEGNEGSRPFIKRLTKALGAAYHVTFPRMPNPEAPAYVPGMTAVKREVEVLEDDGIIIGHSLGGSVLLKFLSEDGQDHRIAGLFLVAVPFWGLNGWAYDEFMLKRGYARHLKQVKRIFVYHSRDDDVVEFAHLEQYVRTLPQAEVRRLHEMRARLRQGRPFEPGAGHQECALGSASRVRCDATRLVPDDSLHT